MIQTVKKFIGQHKMLKKRIKVLVGLSGGADSVSLLLVLHELGYNTHALHCNFRLRGEESDRDEQFVTELCQRLGIPLSVKHFDTRKYARLRHISIEMAARELRYKYFEEMRAELHSQAIAVAHQKEDQAETLLLNIIRGTGIRGLTGMHPVNNHIVRPLLCVSRQEILSYLEAKGQNYVIDSTNKEHDALRNRIRLELIPMLQREFNPGIVNTLVRQCENMQDGLYAYRTGVNQLFKKHDVYETCLRITRNQDNPALPVMLHEWLHGKGFTRSQEKQMLASTGESGRQWLSATHVVTHDLGTLVLLPRDYVPETPVLKQESVEKIGRRTPDFAYFDADAFTYPLTVRLVQNGDRMIPFGERKPRAVRKILKKLSLSKLSRKYAWVVCHGKEIIWIVGVRASNLYRVTPHTTNIVKLSVSDQGLPDRLMVCTD